jgi:hypothetical protein
MISLGEPLVNLLVFVFSPSGGTAISNCWSRKRGLRPPWRKPLASTDKNGNRSERAPRWRRA